MDGTTHGVELERLLAELGWVRRVAGALARDDAAADDLAQDALVRSLDERERAPRSPGALRAWLATIVRRLAVDRGRADAGRTRRELAHACDGHDDPSEIVARSERQQELARAVHALAEPYRTTILLRYLDEITPRDIAERMQCDEALVRKRLSRGLAQLRERLARSHDDLGAWLVLAGAPLHPEVSAHASALTGVSMLNVKIVAACAAFVVLVLAGFGWRQFATSVRDAEPSASAPELANSAPAQPARVEHTHELSAELASDPASPRERAPQSAPAAQVAQTDTPPAAPSPRVEGRVLVDGAARIPRGFAIEGWPSATLTIDAATATYTYGPPPSGKWRNDPDPSSLRITSDETALIRIPVARSLTVQHVDVELSTGRTLELEVLRAGGRTPYANLALDVTLSSATSRAARMSVFDPDSRRVMTDESGRARLTGLPVDGSVFVYRVAPGSRVPDHAGARSAALWTRVLDDRSPRLVAARLVLVDEPGSLRLRGRVEDGDCKTPSIRGRAIVDDQERPLTNDIETRAFETIETPPVVMLDPRHFELAVEPDTTWELWAECDGDRVTDFVRVPVTRHAPAEVVLPRRVRREIAIEAVHVPAETTLTCFVTDKTSRQTPQFVVEAGIARATIRLEQPSTVQITARRGRVDDVCERTVIARVDPAVTGELHVDLCGNAARSIEIAIDGPPNATSGQLVFFKATAADEPHETASALVDAGRSNCPCALSPGTWSWTYTANFPGLAAGVIDVRASTEPLRLRAKLVERPRAELGAGIVLLEVDGRAQPARVPGKPVELHWKNGPYRVDGEVTVWLPENLRFGVLDE